MRGAVILYLIALAITYPILSNFFATTALLPLTEIPPGIHLPTEFKVCRPIEIKDDVAHAIDSWNKMLEKYNVPMRFKTTDHNCTITVTVSPEPLEVDAIATTRFIWRNDNTVFTPEITINMWLHREQNIRRAALSHELGHALLLPHIDYYKGPVRPIMYKAVGKTSPTEVTELDGLLAWYMHVYCKSVPCSTVEVTIPNVMTAAPLSAATSATIATAFLLSKRFLEVKKSGKNTEKN